MGKKLAVFDLDNTIIDGQSQLLLMQYLKEKKMIGYLPFFLLGVWFVAYKLNIAKNPKPATNFALRFVRGLTTAQVDKLVNDFFEENLRNKIFPEMRSLIQDLKSGGVDVVIISNAIEPVVKTVAKYLGVDTVIATKLDVWEDKITGRVDGETVYGEHKASLLKKTFGENVNIQRAYADHISDLEWMKMANEPIAVNPETGLRRIASQKKWDILELR